MSPSILKILFVNCNLIITHASPNFTFRVDMFHPEKDIIFRIEHFKQHRPIAGIFFNCLTNLNKFVAYEQRDPFMIKNELTENPDYSEWDRFAHHEYIRLALEEENAENVFYSRED